MAIVSSGALIDVFRKLHLLSPRQMDEVLALTKGRCADVRVLAKTLITRGWFTVFQINQILAGHSQALLLGPYVILDRLGKGGQSEVYKARHPEYDWTVALKVIRAASLSTPEAAQQFLQEMEAMAELNHPNIVQFWDADKAGEAYYCAMEFVEGTDLGKVVRLQSRLPVAQAAEYVRQTAMGLQHAHEHNLVHRDIKPVNLFLMQPRPADAPLIKILDWGLADLRSTGDSGQRLEDKPGRVHSILGTADYLSPEQALDPRAVDIRGDVYSLGCTMYYLLTGQTPFHGATAMQKVLQHQKVEPTPVEHLNPLVPAGLAAVVRRMMAKKATDRFQTPVAVALAVAPYCRASVMVARV
jgi:serine/threonine-protein kinase